VTDKRDKKGCVVVADNQPHVQMSERALAFLAESSQVINLTFGHSHTELLGSLRRADVVISIYAPISAEMMDVAPGLKAILTFGTGYDHLDVAAATERRIYVSNTRGANAEAVAELSFCLMLNLFRKTYRADVLVREGAWRKGTAFPAWLSGAELWKKTLGIVGLGRIGQRVARIGSGFEMRILAYDPYVSAESARGVAATLVELVEVFRESDVVTIHVPLCADTDRLVDTEKLALMKPTAYLINTCRGPVVDEEALITALQDGRIAGAGLDVFHQEPLPPDHPLLTLDNVILTPHIGGFTDETLESASMSVAERALQVLAGSVPDNLVNRTVLELGLS